MAFSKLTSSLCLVAFALVVHTISISASNPLSLSHICSTGESFTTNTPYETNLKHLLGALYFKVPPTGFGLASFAPTASDRDHNDGAYGVGLCRGDVSSSDCKACVGEASSQLTKLCPHNKGGIIWYDHCLLKYSNTNFFAQIDRVNRLYMYNVKNVSDPVMFNAKTKDMLKRVAEEASCSDKLYAGGEAVLGGQKKVYGLAQCTRDLSASDCNKCLHEAIEELPSCCQGKEGGRVVGGSCNIGYEIYPFLTTHNS